MENGEILCAVAQYLHHRELRQFARSSTAARTAADAVIRDFYCDKQIMLFYGFGGMTDTAELLNPATGEVQLLPPLPEERSIPSVVALGCSVFVCGGSDRSGRALSRVDRFDTIGLRWTTARELSTPRIMMVAGVLQDSIYVCGGSDSDDVLWWGRQLWRSVETYDVLNDRWAAGPAMAQRRVSAASVVFKGCLYVLGGETGDGRTIQILKSVERFDPASGHWQSLPPMSECRHFRGTMQDASIVNIGDFLYVCDGMLGDATYPVLERFDTVHLTWDRLQSPPLMCRGAALLAYRGFLYACGGARVEETWYDDEYDIHDDANTEIQRFDPASGQWSVVANMEWMRCGCTALASAGFVYVLGGSLTYLGRDESKLPLVECFDVETYHRCTLRSSRDGNQRGILGACLCSTVPNAELL